MNEKNENCERLDIAISHRYEGLSRRMARALIDEGSVFINGKRVRISGRLVAEKDRIEITSFDLGRKIIFDSSWILFRNKDVIVINKPSGIPVQETRTSAKNCIIYLIRDYLKRELVEGKSPPFVGLCHRIDAKTSGLVILSLNEDSLKAINLEFAEGLVEKTYYARVEGIIEDDEMSIEMKIGVLCSKPLKYGDKMDGRQSLTRVMVIDRSDKESLLMVFPKTGRTHQIRVHLSSIHHPICGDTLYGAKPARIFGLHSYRMALNIENKRMEFTAPTPDGFWDKEIP